MNVLFENNGNNNNGNILSSLEDNNGVFDHLTPLVGYT